MPDIFISYSRSNAAEMRQIYNAFQNQEKTYNVWVDFEDIEKTVEWWHSIEEGIASSDNFVFILSTTSLASPVCHLEIKTALHNHKRIIPLTLETPDSQKAFESLLSYQLDGFNASLFKDTDLGVLSKNNWEIISSINWIRLGATDSEQKKAIEDLVRVINENPEHKQMHTNLQMKARDWQSNNRDKSLLLHGLQLEQALIWLESRATELPAVTQLQIQYIIKSREAQRQNRIVWLGVALFIFLLVSAIIIASLYAKTQEQAANIANSQIQMDRNLLVSADSLLDAGVPYDAAVFSLQALEQSYSPIAERILSESMTQLFSLWVIDAHLQAVTGIVFIRDDTEILTASLDGTLKRWSSETYELLSNIELASDGQALNLLVTSDDEYAFIGTEDGRILRIALSDESIIEMRSDNGPVLSMALAEDGHYLLTGHSNGSLIVWDINTGEILESKQFSSFFGLAASSNGLGAVSLLTSTGSAEVQIWSLNDALDSDLITTLQFQDGLAIPVALAFSPDNQQLAVGTVNNSVYFVNTANWSAPYQIFNAGGEVTQLLYSDDGTKILIGIRDPQDAKQSKVLLLNLADEEVLRSFTGHQDNIRAIDLSKDATRLLTASADNTARLWSTTDAANLSPIEYSLPESETGIAHLRQLSLFPDAKHLLVLDETETMFMIERETGEITSIRDNLGTIPLVALPSTESILLTGRNADGTGIVRRYDLATETWTTIQELDTAMISFTVLPDGRWLMLDSAGSTIFLGEPDSLRPIVEEANFLNFTLSPDKQYLYMVNFDFEIYTTHIARLDLAEENPQAIDMLEIDELVAAISITPDGLQLGIVDTTGKITIWQIDDIHLIELDEYTYPEGNIVNISFLGDGEHYAFGTGSGEIVIRNFVSDQTERHFFAANKDIIAVLFLDDTIISAGRDNVVREWSLDIAPYLDYACEHLQVIDPLRLDDLPDDCR